MIRPTTYRFMVGNALHSEIDQEADDETVLHHAQRLVDEGHPITNVVAIRHFGVGHEPLEQEIWRAPS